MKNELNDIEGSFPEFRTVIRFLEGHKTDISHPAMGSIKKPIIT
ncbi:MAG: hypothetical protein R6U35_00350 [Candidatus Humimicrobiaceae bacterium]